SDEAEDAELNSLVPCSLSGLKIVEIREFKGCDTEIMFLKFVLKHAEVLEKIDLFFCDGESLLTDISNPEKIRGKLNAIPR
ncbi:hypothetical protein MKW92_014551, partial [Papaver armeniacum]